MNSHWYSFKSCATTIKKDSSPSMVGCSKSSFHTWYNLGEVGDTNYSCKNCGKTIQTNGVPSMAGCSKSSFHSWYKL